LTRRFPDIVNGIAELPNDSVIDGFEKSHAIVLYAFDLLMLQGKDVSLWTLQDRREQLRQLVPHLPDTIRYSETFNAPLREVVGAVRKHQLEGVVAKRASSPYRSGERGGDLLKWRANRGSSSSSAATCRMATHSTQCWSRILQGRDLIYAGSVRAGIPPEFRRAPLLQFEELRVTRCPFSNLPDRSEGRWG
jgi:bifunctional non-homologous end joining protein LigD